MTVLLVTVLTLLGLVCHVVFLAIAVTHCAEEACLSKSRRVAATYAVLVKSSVDGPA